jgi:ABC-type Fe3+-hydroxamate transport system substrate-binding protein
MLKHLPCIYKVILRAGYLICLSLGSMFSCSQAAMIRLTDDLGRSVVVDSEGRRWVSLSPHLTETFLALNLHRYLVAIDTYSPVTASAPIRLSGLSPHQSTIYRLSPSIVWVWYTSPASRLLALERQGIPVFYSDPKQLNDIPALVLKIKPLLIQPAIADQVLKNWNDRIAAIQRKYKLQNQAPIRIFHPFSWRPLLSFNHTHWLSEALKLCGAVSVTDTLSLAAPIVSPSYILQQKATIVLFAEKEPLSVLQVQWRKAEPRLASLSGVVVNPDNWHRPSPRFIEGLEQVCERIHAIKPSNLTSGR